MVLRRLPSLASCIRSASLIRMPTSYRANLRRTLKSRSHALLNDQLWELLEPLLPPWPDEGARQAAGAGSAVPAGHLVRAAYRDRLGRHSAGTRLQVRHDVLAWINPGVSEDLPRIQLAQLNAANEIDGSWAVIDGSYIDTKEGALDLEFAPISSPHVSGVEDQGAGGARSHSKYRASGSAGTVGRSSGRSPGCSASAGSPSVRAKGTSLPRLPRPRSRPLTCKARDVRQPLSCQIRKLPETATQSPSARPPSTPVSDMPDDRLPPHILETRHRRKRLWRLRTVSN